MSVSTIHPAGPAGNVLTNQVHILQKGGQATRSVPAQGKNTFEDSRDEFQRSKVTEQEVIATIEAANHEFRLVNTRFEFSIHEQTKAIMVKVIDEDSNEIIREIPPEKILDMVAKMWELAGILVDERA